MRRSVLGPNAAEKPGLILLLSFQRQIPAGAHGARLSWHPNITHLLYPLSCCIYTLSILFMQLHRICFMLRLGSKKSLSQHTSCTSSPARTCHTLYLANILSNSSSFYMLTTEFEALKVFFFFCSLSLQLKPAPGCCIGQANAEGYTGEKETT